MLDQLSAQLDQPFIEDVARRALDRSAFVLDAWQLQPITCANVSAHSRGLYRVRGSGQTMQQGCPGRWCSNYLSRLTAPPPTIPAVLLAA